MTDAARWWARIRGALRGERVVLIVAGEQVRRVASEPQLDATTQLAGGDTREGLSEALCALVPEPRRGSRRRVGLLVGPPFAEIRRVRGLPLVSDKAVLRDVLVQDPARYLPRRFTDWQLSEVDVAAAGEVTVALLAPEVVSASLALRGCRGVRDVDVAPLLEALAHDAPFPAMMACDGEIHAVYSSDAGLQPMVIPLTGSEDARGGPPDSLRVPFRWPERLRLRYSPPRARARQGTMWLPAVAAAVSLLAWAAVGPVRDRRAIAALDAERSRLARVEAEAHQQDGRLREANLTLAVAEDFGGRRRPVLALLAELAGRLPRPGALVAIRTDSLGGSLAALTPPGELATAALPATLVEQGEVVGPVTREMVGGREVERSSVRFTWATALRRVR